MVGINYIKETEEVINLLLQNGYETIANNLKNTMDGASTGSELIMGVQHSLKQLSIDDVPPVLQSKVKELISGIEELLK